MWYPDIPEAAHWKRYAELVFGDFWRNKEVTQNDTGYFPGTIFMLLTCGDQYLGDDRVLTDPGMQRIWKRLMVEVTPDGAVNPYGPNGGWNSTAGFRLFALELAAAKTRNGEYRYAAHKVLNYLRYQADPIRRDHYLRTIETGMHVALAWLFADDSVEPVMPPPGSLWNLRMENARVPHTDKAVTERLLGNADPDPDKGHICCSHWLTGREFPDKLVLRSGWKTKMGLMHLLCICYLDIGPFRFVHLRKRYGTGGGQPRISGNGDSRHDAYILSPDSVEGCRGGRGSDGAGECGERRRGKTYSGI
jgi:hypothetical protein